MARHPTTRTARRSMASRRTDLVTRMRRSRADCFKSYAIQWQGTFQGRHPVQTLVSIEAINPGRSPPGIFRFRGRSTRVSVLYVMDRWRDWLSGSPNLPQLLSMTRHRSSLVTAVVCRPWLCPLQSPSSKRTLAVRGLLKTDFRHKGRTTQMKKDCTTCGGTGKELVTCGACQGSGQIDGKDCRTCYTQGQVVVACRACQGTGDGPDEE